MTNENFRNELGHVFDEMAGSPSSALPDRVRSSLAHVPEQKGPYWIAGVAAALIALVVIGVLFVGNPLRRQTNTIVPGVGASPQATPNSGLPPFGCNSSTGFVEKTTEPPQPPVAFIDRVITGTQAGYDRMTIEFNNTDPGQTDVTPQNTAMFTQSPSGQSVKLAGNAGLLVTMKGADEHTAYSGSTDLTTGTSALVEARQVQDFEGTVQWALGLSTSACYRAFVLSNPFRLVIDVQVSPAAIAAASCRLPVSWSEMGPTALPDEGFMDLPTGKLSDVPEAHLQVAGSNLAKSPGTPTLIGWPTGSSYYDAARARWLPALGQWVSPDGASYAYLNFDASELHAVDVATGSDQVLVRGKRLYPLAWTADGLYVMDAITGSPVQTYLVAVPGGHLTNLGAKLSSVVPVGGGGAWVAEVSSTVAHISGQNGPIANSISRIDLQSGQQVNWFSAPDASVSVLGFTKSGTPLIQSTDSSGTVIVRLSSPETVAETYSLGHAAVGSVTDTYGTWLLDEAGEAWIYQEGSAPVLVGSAPAGLGAFGLAGGCAPR